MAEIGKGQYRIHIEQLIRDEMNKDRKWYSSTGECHPFYDGDHMHRARAMQEVLDYLLEQGIIS